MGQCLVSFPILDSMLKPSLWYHSVMSPVTPFKIFLWMHLWFWDNYKSLSTSYHLSCYPTDYIEVELPCDHCLFNPQICYFTFLVSIFHFLSSNSSSSAQGSWHWIHSSPGFNLAQLISFVSLIARAWFSWFPYGYLWHFPRSQYRAFIFFRVLA